MTNTNATNLRKNLFTTLEKTAKFNEVVHVSTKDGDVVMMSKSDYDGLMETLYLTSITGLKEKILQAREEEKTDAIDADKVEL